MAETEEIAKRTTADGKTVLLWSDGLVTAGMGWGIKGIGASRSSYERKKDLAAGWLVMGDVELYDFNEVADLVKAARKAVRQHNFQPLEFMRRYVKGERFRAGKHGVVRRVD